MLYNIKTLPLHCVFHGIRFKVNEDWVSVIDTLLFLRKTTTPNFWDCRFFVLFREVFFRRLLVWRGDFPSFFVVKLPACIERRAIIEPVSDGWPWR